MSTRIATKKGTEVPIDYRLLKRGERWRVYDDSIEGVSLIASYRTQFNIVSSWLTRHQWRTRPTSTWTKFESG